MKIKIAIDDGHGINTPGKRTPALDDGTFIRENQFNKPVVDLLERSLMRCGFDVLQVAPEKEDVSLQERVRRANQWCADLYISIHYNAQDTDWGGTRGGVETYYNPGSIDGKRAAELIQTHLLRGTKQINRGIKAKSFYVLRKTTMPAVLVEAGFMDVKREAMLMLNPQFQKEVAEEITQGVCEYFNVDYVR